MNGFYDLLRSTEPLLLFLVIGIGYLLGQIRIRGFKLGVAGVLFAGLAFGAWQPEGAEPLEISLPVREIGLILFVYAVGLTSGAGFFSSLRLRGLRFNAAVIAGLLGGAAVAVVLGRLMGLSPGMIAGAFCGGLTNTPALAAVTELLRNTAPAMASDPTVGYSMSYPFGVLGVLLIFQWFVWWRRDEHKRELEKAAAAASGEQRVIVRNFCIQNPELFDRAIGELRVQAKTGVIISRMRHLGDIFIPTKYTRLQQGDIVVGVGKRADVERAGRYFGAESKERLELSRENIEMRRILVSNRKLAGKTIEELELDRRFNAQITRLRRADIDMLVAPDVRLELGDRLRVVMPAQLVGEVSRFFGDSERAAAELDYTALTLGIVLGVLIGMVPIPIPGGSTVALGIAGGPLVVALILGKIGRTGPIVWSIPLEANEALRHIGLLFFLAGVGVTAGGKFLDTLTTTGPQLLLLGASVTMVTVGITMGLLRWIGHASVTGTLGATSGMHTQPASLARARELTQSDEAYVAYAITYPVAMIGKIILAQLIALI